MTRPQLALGCVAWIVLSVLAVACGYAAFGVLAVAWSELRQLDPNVAAAIIGVCGSILAAAAGVIWNNRSTRLREIQEAHRPEKIRVYSIFFDIVAEVASAQIARGVGEASEVSNLVPRLLELKRGLLVWGSPGVIKSFKKFESAGGEGKRTMKAIDAVLREMRKDLGNSNWLLSSGDLIDLYVKAGERGRLR